eukprot:14965299-Alexandrium_andersonii.AAC.1
MSSIKPGPSVMSMVSSGSSSGARSSNSLESQLDNNASSFARAISAKGGLGSMADTNAGKEPKQPQKKEK